MDTKLRLLLKLANLLLLGTILLFVIRILTLTGPAELREGSVVLDTGLLIQRINPYSLSVVPLYTNVYGILYHLVVLPFATLLGNGYLVHRLVSTFFCGLSFIYFYKILRRQKVDVEVAFSASLILFSQVLYWGYDFLARPDSLGFFLFLLSLFIPYFKKFETKYLLMGLVISIVSFLAKPYFIFSSILLLSYVFFFVSKFKGMLGAVFFVVFTLTLLYSLNKIFPTYIYSTVFIHDGALKSSSSHLYLQIKTFGIYNLPLILISGYTLFHLIKAKAYKFSFEGWCALLSFVVLYLKLGRHTGNFMTYFNHLFTPFFIIGIIRVSTHKKLIRVTTTLLTLSAILWSVTLIKHLPETNIANQNWKEWDQLLKGFSRIYNSPPIAVTLYNQGKDIYDTGQTEFFKDGVPNSRIYGLVKNANAIQTNYFSDIQKKVENKEFDLIVITDYQPLFFDKSTLVKNYYERDTKEMIMFKTLYLAQLWYPKP